MTLALEYPGLEPIEIGAVRYAREDGNFSYTNCVVAEREGEVVGQLCTYPVEATVEEHRRARRPGPRALRKAGDTRHPLHKLIGTIRRVPRHGSGDGDDLSREGPGAGEGYLSTPSACSSSSRTRVR